ncbi:MAG: hypothetical protein ACI9EF_000945 [Pseudohongiellaceae bacterium]|jgi:hypothetical protein
MRLAPLLFALLLTVSGRAAAQSDGGLVVHHSFPLAGDDLVLVIEGASPNAVIGIELEMASEAPPSVQEFLTSGVFGAVSAGGDILTVVGLADSSGMLELVMTLDDPADAGRMVALSFFQQGSGARAECTLLVQPPSVVLPTSLGLQRVDLRTGEVLSPALPGNDSVRGLALSADGRVGYVLREGGALEVRSAEAWDRRPSLVYSFDAGGEELAHGTASGPAFIIVRPADSGLAGLPSAGRLQFLDDRYDDLMIEPLGQQVSGRRWAVSDDGLTAFVAEDDLLVREINLLTGSSTMAFTAWYDGDLSVADMVLQGSRLLVLTRRPAGLPGSLSVYDMTTGRVRAYPLTVDPLRLLVVDGDLALVIPAPSVEGDEGPVLAQHVSLTRVEKGVPGLVDRPAVPLAQLLDAAPVTGGVLVLASDLQGSRVLLLWDAVTGLTSQPLSASLLDSDRLVAAGLPLAVVLGASDGLVRRVSLPSGSVDVLPGVMILPNESFHLLP